jgi:hypothetical protein
MYPNRRHGRAHVLDYSVTRDSTTETRDLRISVLCAGAVQLWLSHVVSGQGLLTDVIPSGLTVKDDMALDRLPG